MTEQKTESAKAVLRNSGKRIRQEAKERFGDDAAATEVAARRLLREHRKKLEKWATLHEMALREEDFEKDARDMRLLVQANIDLKEERLKSNNWVPHLDWEWFSKWRSERQQETATMPPFRFADFPKSMREDIEVGTALAYLAAGESLPWNGE
jgi:hypothetical protein